MDVKDSWASLSLLPMWPHCLHFLCLLYKLNLALFVDLLKMDGQTWPKTCIMTLPPFNNKMVTTTLEASASLNKVYLSRNGRQRSPTAAQSFHSMGISPLPTSAAATLSTSTWWSREGIWTLLFWLQKPDPETKLMVKETWHTGNPELLRY